MADGAIKVLFDTDIGSDIDDAVALAYLLSQPRCELLGITTVTGEPQKRAQLASASCRHAGRDEVPIHAGSGQALLVEMRQKVAPQAKALGKWDHQRDFPPATAVEFLRQVIRANPGEVTLLATGPMTNVALLFTADPEIPAMLKQLVLMCGQFFERMRGEWNAILDPHATAIVYGQGSRSHPPRHVSFGLDVTTKCPMSAETCREKFTADLLAPVRDFAEVWFEQDEGMCFHDPLAAACIFAPDLCTYRQGKVIVSLAEPTMGWTIFSDEGRDKPHTVAAEVNAERFFEHYFDVVR